jgi:hypothetical protein
MNDKFYFHLESFLLKSGYRQDEVNNKKIVWVLSKTFQLDLNIIQNPIFNRMHRTSYLFFSDFQFKYVWTKMLESTKNVCRQVKFLFRTNTNISLITCSIFYLNACYVEI